MNYKCPSCHHILNTEDDFGFVNCESCDHSFWLNIDNEENPMKNNLEEELAPPVEEKASATKEETPSENQDEVAAFSEKIELLEEELDYQEPIETEEPLEEQENLPLENLDPEEPAPQENLAKEKPYDASLKEPESFENFTSDLEKFANSEQSLSLDGNLIIELFISGLKTKTLKDEVFQILQDRKFLIDSTALLATVKEGELRIPDLSTVKAALLIQRLQHLPLQIQWQQKSLERG